MVNKYVNRENPARFVYEHVTDNALVQHPEAGTVHEKLEFHPIINWQLGGTAGDPSVQLCLY